MSEHQSSRDEKGLTISGRTMLRVLMEFGRMSLASSKLGEEPGYEVLQTPTVLLEIRSLLWIASQMAKRIGSAEEITTYLALHAKEDEKAILDGMLKSKKETIEEVLAHNGVPTCKTCGKLICPVCRTCHNCAGSKEHENANPFDFPRGERVPN